MMMIDWDVPFIGREDELETIRAFLQEWGTRRILFILGEGGIGKTRLLHEIEPHFCANEGVKMLPIVDFDDNQYKFPQNVGISIGRQLDPATFDPYLEALRKMRALEEQDAESEEVSALVRRQSLTVNRSFIECFNEVSRKKRIILRIDTTDALRDAVLLEYVHELVLHLDNVFVLIAGRDVDAWHNAYRKDLRDDVRLMRLAPFTISNSRAYLEQKQQKLHVSLEQSWMDKLFLLAGGLPVLIDLAIEWAQNHRSLPWIEEQSLATLQELQERSLQDESAAQKLQQLQKEFKKIVVLPTADLATPFDQLKLILAKVYPLDAEGIREMLNLEQEQTLRLLARARRSVSIKNLPDGRLKLHDEVQRLIALHVWPLLDRDKKLEIRDSRRAIAYLHRKSEALLEDIRRLRVQELEQMETPEPERLLSIFGERREKEGTFWSLRLDLLRRQLALHVDKGYTLFQHDRGLSRQEASSLSYRQGLLTVISPYADFEHPAQDLRGQTLDDDHRFSIQRRLARQSTFDGMYARSAEIYHQLVQRVPEESEEYLKILNGQANQLVRAGKLREAIGIHEQVLRLSQERHAHEWIVQSLLEIGWVQRLMGNLGQAQQYYNDALRLAFEYDDEDRIALIYNNLAYVHAFQHQGKALDEIQQAIRIWKKLLRKKEENRFHLGQCYNVAGEIYLEMERPQESLPFFELSWEIFNREELDPQGVQNRAEWRSKSRSGRGFAYWQFAVQALRQGNQEAAQRHLQDAQRDLQWAAQRATEFDSPPILNRLGEVSFLLKEYDATEAHWTQSMQEARQVGDLFTELHSLSDLARLAFYHPVKKYPTWHDFERWYQRQYERRYHHVHFKGMVALFYTYLGHLAFQSEDVAETIRLYERGLPLLAQTKTYAPFNISDQLDFVEQEIFPQILSTSIRHVGEYLKTEWMGGEHDILALTYFREWARGKSTGSQSIKGRML